MIEPTETEPVEEIDRFAKNLNDIGREAVEHPEAVMKKPLFNSTGQLDDFKASHPMSLKLRWSAPGRE
jgi:glycine cleavage system protein P-like pyridoxal-binding family